MNARTLLRQEAKKVYKEQTKNVPKRQRIPFSEFFKQFKKLKGSPGTSFDNGEDSVVEDFDFENLVNINEISDDSLVVEEDTEEE